MATMLENINNVVIPSLVVKCDITGTEFEKYGIFPNAEDSFIISEEFVNRTESKITEIKTRNISLGSKMIGAYRDKGSITAIVEKEYKLQVDFTCNDFDEVHNFCNFLDTLNKKYQIQGTTVTFEPDVIAGTSTSRDNVNALLIDGLMELDCILDDTTIEMTTEELADITIQDLSDVRNRDHRFYIIDKNGNCVHDFGSHLVIFEYYFWQPMHDNTTYISKKTVNCLYSQAVDGFQIYAPSLYEAIQNSIDYSSIKEDMLCLGLSLDYDIKQEFISSDEYMEGFDGTNW